MRHMLLAFLTIAISTCLTLAFGEGVLRFLPVNDGLKTQAVNEANPVFHFTPNATVTWSKGWQFGMVNQVHVNNAGYVNDQDYDANDKRPLLAVVGDSYVEALMVPYRFTLQGRLAKAVAPSSRVYSLAASGAPLSQYLVWAREARQHWKAGALAVVVVGNDFDESLAMYKVGPGFYHYVERPGGLLKLQRFDYNPGPLRTIVYHSALARYFLFNLQAAETLKGLMSPFAQFVSSAKAQPYVGNTDAAADSQRIQMSQQAVKAFLRDLVSFSGWRPDQVVFLVDGLRYPSSDTSTLSSYFVRMRNYFLAEAARAGFEAIDMDAHFFPRFRATGERYEYPSDGHWNDLAHGLAAKALQESATYARWRRAAEISSGS